MSLEHLFSSSALSLSVSNTSVEFPPSSPNDEWLKGLASNTHERKQAFFDEQLESLVTLRIEHPDENEPADPLKPPPALITFLAHLQIALEASYISSVPISVETPQTTRLSAPPRTASLGLKLSARGGGPHHPSILPPNTPNPTPAAADHDKKYVASQGTVLFTSIWGQTSESTHEEIALLWSEDEQVWVAVYRLALTVAFIRLSFTEPLLCLTISATLREKPVTTSSPQHPFIRFLKSFDGVTIPESPMAIDKAQTQQEDDNMQGFEEVNLLEGLLAGPTFAKMGPSQINLPSTRLGTVSRQKLFSLPPVNLPTPTTPSPSPMTVARGKVHPTLRKSYRKTLQTVSGFRVRMRTVFVPSVVLDTSQEDHDKMTAGNEERTVVLCVEIENSGEAGQGTGFEVEKVDVSISGDEAKATLITWGTEGFKAEGAVFPLKIAQYAQYNLLYAVTFLRPPAELDPFSLARPTSGQSHPDLQRAVSINIHGKPYTHRQESTLYPTRTFSSKWNCVLDLASHQSQTIPHIDPTDPSTAHPSVLPEPPSPFPMFGFQSSRPSPTFGHGFPTDSSGTTIATATANKPQLLAGRILKTSTPRLSSVPMSAHPARMSTPPGPSAQFARSPTTYSAPPVPGQVSQEQSHDRPLSFGLPPRTQTPPSVAFIESPMTPAYPAFSSRASVPSTPMFHTPALSQTSVGIVGPTMEARRGRNSLLSAMEPPTPMPHQYQHQIHSHADPGTGGLTGTFANEQRMSLARAYEGAPDQQGETIVVSIGLLNVIQSGGVSSKTREKEEDALELGPGKIYPLDMFTLDIFVFNRSERTRRFEISYLERRRRRGGEEGGGSESQTGSGDSGGWGRKMGYPGIMPMEGRVRIGPLLSSTCQSVRMEFLAVSPGVHKIEALTLVDIESGYSINLRSVMDIVVHKPED